MFGTKPVKYKDTVYALDQGMVRAFLILGEERGLLFDAGVERADLMKYIREITDLPVELCLSHSDPDHIANIGDFEKLYVHEDEADRLRAFGKADGKELFLIKEGFEVDLGGRKLKVIHCPGHTPGSIALLDEEEKLLFSGDTVSYGPVYMFGEGRDDRAYEETLLRLQEMLERGEFSEIYPCHNRCPADVKAVKELISCIRDIMSGKTEGSPTAMRDGSGKAVLEYREGDCGIYHI